MKNDLKLNYAKKIAVESETSVLSLTAALAHLDHDLRNCTNSIIGMLRLLSDSSLTDQQKIHLEVALKSAENILPWLQKSANILSDPQYFSKRYNEIAVFQIREQFRTIVHYLQYLVEPKNLTIQVTIDSSCPNEIFLHVLLAQQIIANIISQAILLTQSGSIHVKARCDKKNLHISVQVPNHEKIEDFDLRLLDFTHEAHLNCPETTRMALELGVCKNLILKSGGTFEIQNYPLEFQFSFPLLSSSIESKQTDLLTQSHAANKSYMGIHCLLVDDDPINCELGLAYIKRLGGTADSAENGQVAVDLFKKNKYALVLMDCEMPIMDGFDATRLIRQYEKEQNLEATPIIAMTAYAARGAKERTIESGMNEHIPKPVTTAVLNYILEKYILSIPPK